MSPARLTSLFLRADFCRISQHLHHPLRQSPPNGTASNRDLGRLAMVGWECADQNENHEHDSMTMMKVMIIAVIILTMASTTIMVKRMVRTTDDGESDDVLPKDIGSAWTRGSKFCCHLGSQIDSPSINTCQTNLWLQAGPWFLVGNILELHESNQAD